MITMLKALIVVYGPLALMAVALLAYARYLVLQGRAKQAGVTFVLDYLPFRSRVWAREAHLPDMRPQS